MLSSLVWIRHNGGMNLSSRRSIVGQSRFTTARAVAFGLLFASSFGLGVFGCSEASNHPPALGECNSPVGCGGGPSNTIIPIVPPIGGDGGDGGTRSDSGDTGSVPDTRIIPDTSAG